MPIYTATNIVVESPLPLDAYTVFDSMEALLASPWRKEGMLVYIKDEKKYYFWDGTSYVAQDNGGGMSTYHQLVNKPSINGVELAGDKTSTDLGLVSGTVFENAIGTVNSSLTETSQKAATALQPDALNPYSTTDVAKMLYATRAQGELADTALQQDVADSRYAAKSQGDLADTAVQLEVLSQYSTTTDADSRYAMQAQGTLAATAVQPDALDSILVAYSTTAVADTRYATKTQGELAETAIQSTSVRYMTQSEFDTATDIPEGTEINIYED